MNEYYKIPPIGLRPKYIARQMRIEEIKAAIMRYLVSDMEIKREWIEEYNQLVQEDMKWKNMQKPHE